MTPLLFRSKIETGGSNVINRGCDNCRYIRYHNGKEELYDVIKDPKEWNNLAMTKKFESILTNYRNELDNRLPAAIPRPTPSKESAEAWKDSYFKKFPKADINGDGILSWYELKQHKGD